LATDESLDALIDLCGAWIERANERTKMKQLILDMDSSESPTHGQQEGSAYKGHFGCTCYHPLFCFNHHGDLERAMLRPGNVHSAHDWLQVLKPAVARYKKRSITKFFRGDASFAGPDLYRFLEEEKLSYAVRLPANENLQREIEHLLTRPVGRPSKQPKVFYHSFSYQAMSWDQPRRIVAKVEWHSGELFPRIGFIVTNLRWRPNKVV